jgi:hypothetical protein
LAMAMFVLMLRSCRRPSRRYSQTQQRRIKNGVWLEFRWICDLKARTVTQTNIQVAHRPNPKCTLGGFEKGERRERGRKEEKKRQTHTHTHTSTLKLNSLAVK